MPNAWQAVLDDIKEHVSEMAYNTYFVSSVNFVSKDNGVVTISVPNSFIKASIEKKYSTQLLNAIKAAGLGDDFKIIESDDKNTTVKRVPREIPIEPEAPVIEPKYKPPIMSPGYSPKKNSTGLDPKYRLDNYIVGSNNDLAVNAAQAVIEEPGRRYNPFFLYGGSGLGKTHLIQAIGNEIHEANPDLKIIYVTTEELVNEFIAALGSKKISEFKKKYRSVDVLIVDDFQFIQKKDASQDEFFHTFNELYKDNKQVIVSADRLPSQIETVDVRLASRLTMGVSIDIQMPDFETRCAIIKAKAAMLGETIDNTSVEYLADNINTNIRDLEGALNRLLLLAQVRHVSTSEVLEELEPITKGSKRHVSSKQLIERVAKYYNLSSKDLLGTSRTKDIKNARQIAMYLMNEELSLSTVKIGDEFKKDHSTVIHSLRKVKDNLKSDFSLREQISELRNKIYAN